MRISRLIIFRKVLQIIKKIKQGGTVLEIGCAYGELVSRLNRAGYFAEGCDISRFALTKSRERFPGLDFFHMDISQRTALPGNHYDVVIALDVIEHCKDLRAVLREMRRISKRDAAFLISVPDVRLFPKEQDMDSTHVWFLTQNEWRKRFEENLFKIRDVIVYPRALVRVVPTWCKTFFELSRA